MNIETFKNLRIGSIIVDLKQGDAWKIIETHKDFHQCECINENRNYALGYMEKWHFDCAASFELCIESEPQSTMQEMTVADALKNGLKVGDKILMEFEVTKLPNKNSDTTVYNGDFSNDDLYLLYSAKILFTPRLYTPAHNETCVIKTKNGLATKAIAVHYNGKISAISIDSEGNTDCHFKAEQIEKFLPLPPA